MNPIANSQFDPLLRPTEELPFLHQFLERAVAQRPEHIAVDVPPGIDRTNRRLVTYRELARQRDVIANWLRTLVTEECVVAILLPRRTEHLYSSQLAVLTVGAAYTCIDTSFPDQQVRDILEDSKAVALLTDGEGWVRAQRAGYSVATTLNIDDLLTRRATSVIAQPTPSWLKPTSLAYIIYTSGTTGRPKGVMIEHASIANLVAANLEELGISADDRVAQGSSPAYDSSIEEIWLAFACGATLVVMDDDATRLGPDLIPWLRRERINVLCPPPTLLRATGCEDPKSALPDLSFLYVGGEALPIDVAERWANGRRLVNGYGPTECSVTSVRGRIIAGEPITIGRPVRALSAWVLDQNLEEVADGERGELCLGGVGLARGYRNRPDLTAAKFPDHPRLGRIYRTGDLVHRDAGGCFFYHGRIDSQVKLRGYRVELEAIEARLAECDGVREAACRVQQNGSQQLLVGFVVPEADYDSRFLDVLKASLLETLPAYMVPTRIAVIQELPLTVGGKLNREKLPYLETQDRDCDKPLELPRNQMELKVAASFQEVLRLKTEFGIHEDFFNDLGGDSLHAAELISLLRDEPSTASVTVRDLYEARTVAELAKRAHTDDISQTVVDEPLRRLGGRTMIAAGFQVSWLLIGLILGSTTAYLVTFNVLPVLMRSLGLITFLFLSPLFLFAGLLLYTPFAVLLATLVKRTLIGRYRTLRAPVWGNFYIRNWMVQQTVRIVPWGLLQGTVFQVIALRALGARIGRRVHIHQGVNLLQGGWDLLEIGDDVTLSQDSAIRLVDLDDGHVTVGPITLGSGSTLDVRAGVSSNTVLEPDAFLTALSSLPEGGRIPRGERWDGIPAVPGGRAPYRAGPIESGWILSPAWHGVATILARLGLWLIITLAVELPTVVLALFHEVDADDLLQWLFSPSHTASIFVAAFLMVTLPIPLAAIVEALIMRAMGRVHSGIISRWSIAYLRVCLKTKIVESAGQWLSGTLFWPMWLRLAGMKIGRGCEISTIIDVVPELVEIGSESFFADGIYLCGPRIHQGTVTLAETRLGKNTFLGNHSVIPAGQQLPDDVLIGICTVADDAIIRPDSDWFGQPPFELPRREVIEFDRSLTHEPSLIRYLDRVFWEVLRNGLLIVPLLVFPVWCQALALAEASVSPAIFLLGVVPLVTLATVAFFCLLVIGLKWGLLGRVRPGVHAFWSCWCSRWDFLYVAWGFYASGALSTLEGTPFLAWYLRAMGCRIGRGVILGGGFAQVVDPDMLEFEDGATVNCQFQAHTFEDRVLKIDRVIIRRRATVGSGGVLLYGADIGAGAHVAPHSVVMKRESLLAGHSYTGCPTRPVSTRTSEL